MGARVALVTGGTGGIGTAICRRLAAMGHRVATNYRNEEKARAWQQRMRDDGYDIAIVPGDVASPASAADIVRGVEAQLGPVDILVNNAGITRDKTLRKLTDEDWHEVIQTNLNSVYYTVSAAQSIMVEQKYGRIINISSFVGQAGNFGQTNYAASKGGIIAFTKSAAQELAKYNITINALAPGFTQTDMLAQVPENVQEKILAKIPMGRFGTAEEIAKAVLFLAADADYITGQQINVNGGIYM